MTAQKKLTKLSSLKPEPNAPNLVEYKRKRNFTKTPEPEGKVPEVLDRLRFVVQKHAATLLHYDLRLELDGDFKSWAVPKGPSLNPSDQRLAVRVENHPIEYGSFEGIIPPKNYGAGTVMIWDAGWLYSRKTRDYELGLVELLKGYEKGHMTFILDGQKLRGEFALIRLKDSNGKSWLLVKKGDQFCNYKLDVLTLDKSVATGRSMEEIKLQANAKGEVWIPGAGNLHTNLKSPYIHKPIEVDEPRGDPMPHRIKPMLPLISKKLFLDEQWIYEPLHAGPRAILELDGKTVALYSKGGLSLAPKFANLVSSLRTYAQRVVLDGQVVIPNGHKKPRFLVFDILYIDKMDLRQQPLIERKLAINTLFKHSSLVFNCWLKGKLPETTETSLLVRHSASDYRSGIHAAWQQCPNEKKQSNHKAPVLTFASQKEKPAHISGPVFTNLKKVYWPETRHTKGDVVAYYKKVARYLLPYLKDRPLSLHRHPNGVSQPSFFQKDVQGYLPTFVETVLVKHSDKSVNYIVCQNEETLLYLANLGCIELNPWLSRRQSLDIPDWTVIDLDPLEIDFGAVLDTAIAIREYLKEIKVTSFCKTSGSKGLHIYIPTLEKTSYQDARLATQNICIEINKRLPGVTSVDRNPSARRRRVYLDFMQNVWGKTIASPYCLRPKTKPMVSMPLKWSEVKNGLKLEDFTIDTVPEMLANRTDPWEHAMSLST